ncbi:MAG: hypothetical protein P8104_00455 [Gammaproteobacteria bacterium]
MKNRIAQVISICLLSFSTQSFSTSIADATMHVFVPTDVRTNILQKKLESVCPDLSITVFGRGQDFVSQSHKTHPDVILTLMPVIEKSSGYHSYFIGLKNGVTSEPYLLVSKDREINTTDLSNKTIGVLDLLGRKLMTEYVHQLLKQNVKVKRVTKREDLLPLLIFNAANAILVSRSVFGALSEKSQLNLVATEMDVSIGLAALAANDDAVKDKLDKCIKKFDSHLNTMLGVDQWTKN